MASNGNATRPTLTATTSEPPHEHTPTSNNASRPSGAKRALTSRPSDFYSRPHPTQDDDDDDEDQEVDQQPQETMADPSSSTSSSKRPSSTATPEERHAAAQQSRPMFNRLQTLPSHRVLDSPETRNRPLHQWTIPRSSHSGKTPRAATLFLGKDHERWRLEDRDNMGQANKYGLGWRRGSSSAIGEDITSGSEVASTIDTDEWDVFTDEESETSAGPSSGSRRLSRRASHRSTRSSNSSGFFHKPGHGFQPLSSTEDEPSMQRRLSAVATSQDSALPAQSERRRRFSSNGPEAAIHRHETVIGLHTPRRDSNASLPPAGAKGLTAALERAGISPLSQVKVQERDPSPISPLPSGSPSKLSNTAIKAAAPPPSAARPGKPRREMSSSDLLKKAAAAAASATASASSSAHSSSLEVSHESQFEKAAELGLNVPLTASPAPASPAIASPRPTSRASSPAGRALHLARRRKPIKVEGTLYDRSGPFREGAVTDGLSVRLFSADLEAEGAGWADEEDEQRSSARYDLKRRSKGQLNRSQPATAADSDDDRPVIPAVKDAAHAMTYLITTPDNRVSSAAKLRRWAMDGDGRFYAAMEIKSVEAKVRSALDPTEAAAAAEGNKDSSAGYARSLVKILRQTYVDDLLNEVQKAETLNPDCNSVAKILVTDDGKYVRLEEDYPEEAFFVIAGCEEFELYPVVALVFIQALRHIHRFHTAGWMHGDIKLENLMFDSRGDLVIIDYENSNPYVTSTDHKRGGTEGDGQVQLMSFDWIPPEAAPGPDGRRAGPGADLWALGANLVRAFALRDGIEDGCVRELLLESGQTRFLQYRDRLITCDEKKQRATAFDVNLKPILEGEDEEQQYKQHKSRASSFSSMSSSAAALSGLPTPRALLLPFAERAPRLLKYVLASCLVLSPSARSIDAELEGLKLARELEQEKGGETMQIAQRAVRQAIELSGSEWVRPKLEEARRSLGLGAEGEEDEEMQQ